MPRELKVRHRWKVKAPNLEAALFTTATGRHRWQLRFCKRHELLSEAFHSAHLFSLENILN